MLHRRHRLADALAERLGESAGAAAFDALRQEFGGAELYVPKRPRVDSGAVRRELQSGRTLADVAREFEVSVRTVRRYRSGR